jgi:hypothetical protein
MIHLQYGHLKIQLLGRLAVLMSMVVLEHRDASPHLYATRAKRREACDDASGFRVRAPRAPE